MCMVTGQQNSGSDVCSLRLCDRNLHKSTDTVLEVAATTAHDDGFLQNVFYFT